MSLLPGSIIDRGYTQAERAAQLTKMGIPVAINVVKPVDREKAYNAHRLEEYHGARSINGVDAKGYQDHYFEMPDGSIWRFRNPSDYYSKASGKAMCVFAAPSATSDRLTRGLAAYSEGKV